MITTQYKTAHSIRAPKTIFPQLVKGLANAAARLIAHHRERRQIAVLGRMDARQLKDIGLTPGDVDFALSLPLGQAPAATLQRLTRERRAAERAMARENFLGLKAARTGSHARQQQETTS